MANIRDFEPILPDPQPYVGKALALYERAVREKRGHIVFIAAELGGGKTDLLNSLAQALHHAKPEPNFVAGFFRGGEYHRHTLEWQEKICLKRAALAVGETASLLGFFPGLYAFAASFIGQLLQTSVSAYEFVNEFKKHPRTAKESADWLRHLLRRTAEERPLVSLLDDWDQAQRFYWDNMVLSSSREIAQDLPLLLFLTVTEPINLTTPEKDESGLTMVVKTLTEKGLAELWRLRKLSRDEVAKSIGPAASDIATKLHSVTGGNARWVQELWREWRLNEVVVVNEADYWTWGAHPRSTIDLYNDILRDRLVRLINAETAMGVEEPREVLACAALEGTSFTADAVARTLDWDTDELIDFLDDVLVQTEDNTEGLLLEDDSIQIPEPDGTIRTLWRYSFLSDLHWMAMERYGFANEPRVGKPNSERLEMSAGLVIALKQTYAHEERFAAAQLARLLRDLGDEEAARYYQRVADCATDRKVMREQALSILAINKDDWGQWERGRSARFLIEAGQAMADAFPHHETLAVFEEACKLAREANYESEQAQACFLCSTVLYRQGEYDSARDKAKESLNVSQLIGSKGDISNSLEMLARLDYAQGKYAEAAQQAAQALEICRKLSDGRRLAQALLLLAEIHLDEGNYSESRQQAEQALEISQRFRHLIAASGALLVLANINHKQGNYADARSQAENGLEISQELGNRAATGSFELLLARVAYRLDSYPEALDRASHALRISKELGNLKGEAASLGLLGGIAYECKRTKEAADLVVLDLLISAQMGDVSSNITLRNVKKLVREQQYTEDQVEKLFQQVSRAYEKDGGQELIEKTLATLREVIR